ncbi:MAG: NHL repeat-containing protein, partial [Planctomycetota bacterium]
ALSGVEPSPLEPVDLKWLDDGSLLLLDERLGRLVVATPPPATRPGHDPLPSEVVAVWGPQGSGGAAFAKPIALAVSPAGDAVAVLDAGPPGGPATIEVLSRDGLPRDSFDLPRVLRSDDDRPLVPGGLAWTEAGFAITDRLADRLLLLDERGVLRHETGTTGTADGELWSPRGLAVCEDGTVIVVDTGNHRVQGFSADDASWRIVFSLGRASTRKRTPGPPGISE